MQETPKERAESLVLDFMKILPPQGVTPFSMKEYSKKCAIQNCDSIIQLLELLHKPEYATFDIKDPSGDWYNGYSLSEYYEEVKKEIDLL